MHLRLCSLFLTAMVGLAGCIGTPADESDSTASPTPSMAAPQAKQMYIVATDFSTPASEGFYKFRPQTFSAKVGETINLTIKNGVGNRDVHNLVLDGHGLRLVGVKDGTTSTEFAPSKAGSFKYYCDLMYGPGVSHRQAGFEGTLTIN